MDPWEAMERQNHVPAERGVIPVNGGQSPLQHEHDGAKTDGFVHKDQSCRYASSDIPSDLLVKVGGINYHLHKHPMIPRSGRLARLVDEASPLHGPDATIVIEFPDLPGGHVAFELVAKFCYGIAIDITATNVAALRCVAAEYCAALPVVGKQQGVSGWTSGWKKLGRLGRVQAEHPIVTASPDQAAGSREPRRRRNSAS